MSEITTDLPLSGVRILDCVDGPLQGVGRILADLGADVIRVEPPVGSPARHDGQLVDEVSLTFAVRNANKHGAALDLETAEGRGRFGELLSGADILIADWSPEQQEHYGLAEPELRAAYPRLVAAMLSDFGRTGPRAQWVGSPDVLFALSTVLSRSGLPEVERPVLPPVFLAYEAATAQAAWAITLAFTRSLSTGTGDYVDFSVLEALIQVLDPGMGIGGSARAGAPMKDLPRSRPDSRHLYPIFPTKDGWARICVLSARQWQGMFEWLGRPAEFADDKFNNLMQRFAAAKTLYPLIGALFAGLSKEEVTEQGQAHGVPTAALLSASEVLAHPAFHDAGSFTTVDVGGRQATVPTGVYEIDGHRAGIRFPAPSQGEHDSFDDNHAAVSAIGTGDRPFEGLRVLDLGVIVVGAELGRIFGDYGAEVIKVESREFPDGSRQSFDGSEMTEGFAWGHRNKRSLGLNLKSDQGKLLFADLVAKSDVVLTNFKPGTLESLGFGYEALAAINPRIVLSESSAFGNTGPWSSRMGYGPLVRASAGMSLLWSYPEIDGSFSDAITIFPDHVVARLNAIAVTALLLRRTRTGRGGRVSTAQVDTIFSAMGDRLARESLVPGSVRIEGSRRRLDAPRGIFPASGDDNWLVIDVTTSEQFAALAAVVGHPEWAADRRFDNAHSRLEHEAELVDAVSDWTSSRDAESAATELQAAGIPAGHMVRVPELLDDVQLSARGVFGVQRQPQIPDAMPANLGEARFAGVPSPLLGTAPLQAEHTQQIAHDVIGLDDPTIDSLIESGTLQIHPSVALQKA